MFNLKKFLFLLIALLVVWALSAQTEPPANFPDFEDPTLGKLLDIYNLLYGALVVIWGYLAKLLGLKSEKIPFVFVVLAGGLVLAGGFVLAGWTEILPLVFSFLSAIGIFDLILKPAQKYVLGK